MLNWIFGSRKVQKQAESLYKDIVLKSRHRAFYADYGVPDTLDGRFEMIAMNVFLEMSGLNKSSPKMAQALFDAMFIDMDRSARERGVGDLSVPKHMKRMMKALHGRAKMYQDALSQQNDVMLHDAIKRNIFGTVESPDPRHISYFISYMRSEFNKNQNQNNSIAA